LTLEKLKYAFESWWQTPAIAGGVFLQLIKIVMRDEGAIKKIFVYEPPDKMHRLHIKLQECAVIATYFARARS
jgi:hypothetical protein